MACNSSSGCQSGGCYKNEEDSLRDQTPTPTATGTGGGGGGGVCIKCKTNPPISTTSTSSSPLDADNSRFCFDCFRSNLYGKFRLAVTSHAMISPSDNVLLAVSGGPASRVTLQFVHEMQVRAQKNLDASREKALPVFGVGVAFVEESCVSSVSSDQVDRAVEEMRVITSNLSPPMKQFHVVPIQNVYASDPPEDAKDRFRKLLDAVTDATGKEDLLLHMRMLALQKVASENGYSRLVLGSCTSRIACHVIAATVKGQGYSLSADIQYVDSRWQVPVVLPLRDCTEQELNLLCRLDGLVLNGTLLSSWQGSLKTPQLCMNPTSGINGLVSSFVTLLKEENPSRECTIVRTAGKLTPFHFNRVPETNDCNGSSATLRRLKKYNLNTKESLSSELFCPICNSPLQSSDFLGSPKITKSVSFDAACCSSCRFQILPKDPSSLELFSLLLPQQVVGRAKNDSCGNLNLLRERIQDCLLSDSEDET
ncbi:hypothetical protein Tsubulata_013323 [Turnera subulata]|uniref:Cytoplasmic tRNA 2-thiolation protein 2 n=1 Tax=Turnera subulata TaxID=218843 RepID=A0A9Q0G5M6_9ROSI|nr:hypothetical protein Tsubulata_013323 [Turnera subulata]